MELREGMFRLRVDERTATVAVDDSVLLHLHPAPAWDALRETLEYVARTLGYVSLDKALWRKEYNLETYTTTYTLTRPTLDGDGGGGGGYAPGCPEPQPPVPV